MNAFSDQQSAFSKTLKKQLKKIYCQDVRAWLIAALTAERITTTLIRGGHLTAAHDVQRE